MLRVRLRDPDRLPVLILSVGSSWTFSPAPFSVFPVGSLGPFPRGESRTISPAPVDSDRLSFSSSTGRAPRVLFLPIRKEKTGAKLPAYHNKKDVFHIIHNKFTTNRYFRQNHTFGKRDIYVLFSPSRPLYSLFYAKLSPTFSNIFYRFVSFPIFRTK